MTKQLFSIKFFTYLKTNSKDRSEGKEVIDFLFLSESGMVKAG
ncbi:hypothetical protein JOC78_002989 [Bacillus ectoiniformans]|nr:hypothetical protein [Bacillus ectoiniformans]